MWGALATKGETVIRIKFEVRAADMPQELSYIEVRDRLEAAVGAPLRSLDVTAETRAGAKAVRQPFFPRPTLDSVRDIALTVVIATALLVTFSIGTKMARVGGNPVVQSALVIADIGLIIALVRSTNRWWK